MTWPEVADHAVIAIGVACSIWAFFWGLSKLADRGHEKD